MTPAPRHDLLGLRFSEYAAWARSIVGHSDRFHSAGYRQIHRSGAFDPDTWPLWDEAERQSPGVRARFAAAAIRDLVPLITGQREVHDEAIGATRKLLLQLPDGAAVETVAIPMGVEDGHPDHHTVCVSSQVGCKMGCTFCQTAKLGLVRQLAAHEIVAQVAAVSRHLAISPRNVVFMGMGEPLDNAPAVAQAVQVLTDVHGWRLQRRHVTISTVGRADILSRWAELGLTGINLAVSLFVADDGLRAEFMPVNRAHPLAELKAALQRIPLTSKRRILVSVVVIPGINDTPDQCQHLIRWLHGLPALVNLIPYNPIPDRPWRAPTSDEITAMRMALEQARIPVRIRTTKGDSVMAACGQLGDPAQRRRPKPV